MFIDIGRGADRNLGEGCSIINSSLKELLKIYAILEI
jgi:hypothetical protein